MGMCILQHAPASQGAEAYKAIARIVDSDSTGGGSSAVTGSVPDADRGADADSDLDSE